MGKASCPAAAGMESLISRLPRVAPYDHREGGDLSGNWKKTVENHSLGRVGKGGYSSGLFPTLFNLKRGKK